MLWQPGILIAILALSFAVVLVLRDMWVGKPKQLPYLPDSVERAD